MWEGKQETLSCFSNPHSSGDKAVCVKKQVGRAIPASVTHHFIQQPLRPPTTPLPAGLVTMAAKAWAHLLGT